MTAQTSAPQVELLPCPLCKKMPGMKVGPPALARCITDGCDGKKLGAFTLIEWNTRPSPDSEGVETAPVAWRYKHSSHRSWAYMDEKPEGVAIHLFEVQPLYAAPQASAGERGIEDSLTAILDEAWADGHREAAKKILERFALSERGGVR